VRLKTWEFEKKERRKEKREVRLKEKKPHAKINLFWCMEKKEEEKGENGPERRTVVETKLQILVFSCEQKGGGDELE
jgi:hypothetical protein